MDEVSVKQVLNQEDVPAEKLFALKRLIFVAADHRKEFDQTLKSFKTAVNLSSESKRNVRRATAYWLNGEVERAVEILEKARPGRERDLVLGLCYSDLGRFRSAVPLLESAFKAGEDLHVGSALAETLIRAGETSRAEPLIQRLLKKNPESPEPLYLKGLLQDILGFHQEAIQAYEEALDREPDHQKSLFRLAYKKDMMGEDSQAIELYDQLRLLRPLHVNTMLNLGILFEDRGEYTKAIECYEAVLEFYPNHWRARMYYEDARASLRMYYDEEALKKEERRKQLAGQHIADLPLSTRAKNALLKARVFTLADLVAKTEEELLEVGGLGQTAIKEIKELLNARRLSLATQKEISADEYLKSIRPDILAKPLSEFDWSGRSKKLFEKLGFVTVGDLVRNTEADLLRNRNFGETSLREIRQRLAEVGVELRPG